MALTLAAMVVVTLAVTGLARIPVGEPIDADGLSGEPPAAASPSLLAQGARSGSARTTLPQSGGQGPVSQAPAAAAVAPPAEGPAVDSSRMHAESITATLATATPPRTPETAAGVASSGMSTTAGQAGTAGLTPAISGPDTPAGTTGGGEHHHRTVASLSPAEAASLSPESTDAPHDASETAGPAAGPDRLVAAETTLALQDLDSLDPPGAGGGTDRQDPAGEPAVHPPVSREARIAALLARGQASLQDFRLLTPAGDNAHQYFQQVIALDPGNAAARDGLERIVASYVLLVRRAKERQEAGLARLYISRGLSVQPGNTELLALQDSLLEPPAGAQEAVVQASPDDEPEQQTQPQPQLQQESVFAWLKSLFNVAESGQPEVVERSIPPARH